MKKDILIILIGVSLLLVQATFKIQVLKKEINGLRQEMNERIDNSYLLGIRDGLRTVSKSRMVSVRLNCEDEWLKPGIYKYNPSDYEIKQEEPKGEE